MSYARNLRIFAVFCCALAIGVAPAFAQEPPGPAQEEGGPALVPQPEPEPTLQGQNLSVASPARNTEVSFFVGGLVGGDITTVVTADFNLLTSLQDGRMYGARAGYYTFPLGVEGSFTYSKSGFGATVDLPEINVELASRVRYLEANALLFLIPGPVQPFVTGGGGMHAYDLSDIGGVDINRWGWNFGGGIKLNLGRVALRADVRDHLTSIDDAALGIDPQVAEALGLDAQRLHNVEITFGVGFKF